MILRDRLNRALRLHGVPATEARILSGIGSDGIPLSIMSCIDPRAFALHKLWLSRRADRSPAQRPREAAQAVTVAALVLAYLNLSFESRDLSALPKALRQLAPELKKAAKVWLKDNPPRQED